MSAATHRAGRILLVDDERHNRQLLELMLAPEGFEVLTASSGEEALALVGTLRPDLILLDIMMPGIDGYTVARRLKGDSATKNIPIIIVTDLDDRQARMRGLTAGAEDYLTKPVDRTELGLRVRNLLRLKEYGDYHDKYSRMLEGEVGSRRAQLIEGERLYRTTFDAAPVGIAHVGPDGRWLQVNQRLCDMLAYPYEALQSMDISELMPEMAESRAELLRDMFAGKVDRHTIDELRLNRGDGGHIWARVNIAVYRDKDGAPQHLISVLEDITERRTLDAQVRQSNKMDAVGRLASGVAHDFNNLLTVILGFAEILSANAETGNQHRKDVGEIVRAAEQAARLTNQLLAFSRQQVLHAVPIDLNGLIADMSGMLKRLIGEHITVDLVLAPNLCPTLADRGQIEQVVMNLVVNARDAMPGGGTVTIETAEVTLENSEFREEAIAEGQYVMLAITDTGAGMTKETQRRLFEPFFTTKETGKGTGLGLSTTYGIVKQSKGYIWVYSEPESGTTFKVYLPRTGRSAAVPLPEAVVSEPAPHPSETLLLVEDEAGVRRLSKRILEAAGYHVLDAANGDEAERLFMQHAGAIDLLVTDVIMPGCGGPELLGRLQGRAPNLRVLYMSGYTEQSAAQRAGIDAGLPFVQKPFTAAELRDHARKALNR